MFSFIVRGRLYGLLILFCPPSLYVLSSRCSFHCCLELWWLSLMPCLPLYVWIIFFFVYVMWLGRLFLVSSLVSDFLVVGFHSLPLRLFIFFSCISWCRCDELVFWSFGFFYPELCVSSLAWAPCLFLFNLWSVSYLFVSGYASSTLGMCLPASWLTWAF